MKPSASVVIPAHNESAVIGRLLEVISPLAESGHLDVHVVCNGCIDDTVAIARKFAGIIVHDLAIPSKCDALNYGDHAAGDVYPRLFVDADIVLNEAAIWKVIGALTSGRYLAAAPRLRISVDGRPWIVRDFYAIFMQSSWVTDGLIGSGFYALSREGRSHFDVFPNLINDDLFVRKLFSTDQRCSVEDAEFWIEAPLTLRALIRAKTRVYIGTQEFLQLYPPTTPSKMGEPSLTNTLARFFGRINSKMHHLVSNEFLLQIRQPLRWRKLTSYAVVRLAGRSVSLCYRLRGRDFGWAQDRTTRVSVSKL
jgi:glycosyltransferase involved in cell wall biosynthesis